MSLFDDITEARLTGNYRSAAHVAAEYGARKLKLDRALIIAGTLPLFAVGDRNAEWHLRNMIAAALKAYRGVHGNPSSSTSVGTGTRSTAITTKLGGYEVFTAQNRWPGFTVVARDGPTSSYAERDKFSLHELLSAFDAAKEELEEKKNARRVVPEARIVSRDWEHVADVSYDLHNEKIDLDTAIRVATSLPLPDKPGRDYASDMNALFKGVSDRVMNGLGLNGVFTGVRRFQVHEYQAQIKTDDARFEIVTTTSHVEEGVIPKWPNVVIYAFFDGGAISTRDVRFGVASISGAIVSMIDEFHERTPVNEVRARKIDTLDLTSDWHKVTEHVKSDPDVVRAVLPTLKLPMGGSPTNAWWVLGRMVETYLNDRVAPQWRGTLGEAFRFSYDLDGTGVNRELKFTYHLFGKHNGIVINCYAAKAWPEVRVWDAYYGAVETPPHISIINVGGAIRDIIEKQMDRQFPNNKVMEARVRRFSSIDEIVAAFREGAISLDSALMAAQNVEFIGPLQPVHPLVNAAFQKAMHQELEEWWDKETADRVKPDPVKTDQYAPGDMYYWMPEIGVRVGIKLSLWPKFEVNYDVSEATEGSGYGRYVSEEPFSVRSLRIAISKAAMQAAQPRGWQQ